MTLCRGTVVPFVVAVGAVLVTACGSASSPGQQPPGSKTVAQIVPAMKSAAESAKSVQMSGTVQAGSRNLTFDIAFAGNSDLSGTFTENGASVTAEVIGSKTYVKLNRGFLGLEKLPASICATVCGKYVALPAAAASQITSSVSASALFKQAFGKIPSSVSKDTADYFVPGTFQGQPVLTAHGGGYTIDVARTGPPYPVMISGSAGYRIAFSQWNAVPPLTPPPASEVISLGGLSNL